MMASWCPMCQALVSWKRENDAYIGICAWCGYEPDPIAALVLPYDVPRFTGDNGEPEVDHADDDPQTD